MAVINENVSHSEVKNRINSGNMVGIQCSIFRIHDIKMCKLNL
jgi:hypothetical protein